MKYDVFISYARKDYLDDKDQVIPGNIVSQIKELFDTNNITYWFDEDGTKSGDEFAGLIARNIKDSQIFLFISSKNSNASLWTTNEIATARAYKKKIIPFRYDESIYNESVMIYIASLDFVEYYKNPQKALQRLLTSIQTYFDEIEQVQKEHQRQLLEKISLEEKNKQIKELKENLLNLERRKIEMEQEILEQEKTIVVLKNEKRIVDIEIDELQKHLNTINIVDVPIKRTNELTMSDWILICVLPLTTAGTSLFLTIIFTIINLICRAKGKQNIIKPKLIQYLFISSILLLILLLLIF